MRSYKNSPSRYRISAGGESGPKFQSIEGITVLLSPREKVLTILEVQEGVRVRSVMEKNYDRLRRAGFTFVLASSAFTPIGTRRVIECVNRTRKWTEEIQEDAIIGDEHSVKFNF